jgi:DNA-binding GntR family transcriptional regulator
MYDQQVDLVGDGETDGRLHAVMRAVRAHIHDHGLQAGDALPSEGAFAQMTGVSRTIVRGLPVAVRAHPDRHR